MVLGFLVGYGSKWIFENFNRFWVFPTQFLASATLLEGSLNSKYEISNSTSCYINSGFSFRNSFYGFPCAGCELPNSFSAFTNAGYYYPYSFYDLTKAGCPLHRIEVS